MKQKLKNFHLISQNPLLKGIFQVTKVTLVLICLSGFVNVYGADTAPLTAGQQRTKQVSGKVTDDTGQTVPGASVVVKGTTIGTITNMDGGYSLNIPADSKTLVFSFVGMLSQEVSIGTKNMINVMLAQETIGLNEVVAIGYGTVRKKDLTGSVSSVGSSKLMERSSFSAAQAL